MVSNVFNLILGIWGLDTLVTFQVVTIDLTAMVINLLTANALMTIVLISGLNRRASIISSWNSAKYRYQALSHIIFLFHNRIGRSGNYFFAR